MCAKYLMYLSYAYIHTNVTVRRVVENKRNIRIIIVKQSACELNGVRRVLTTVPSFFPSLGLSTYQMHRIFPTFPRSSNSLSAGLSSRRIYPHSFCRYVPSTLYFFFRTILYHEYPKSAFTVWAFFA